MKPNLGHSEGASGITSVIKSVLSLEHGIIAPNIYLNTPNPEIEWKNWNLHVPTEATPWPYNTCERISVNSFGIGGANAHAILDSASSFNVSSDQNPVSGSENRQIRVFVVSARSEKALKKRVDDIVQYSSERPTKLHDLAYTLSVRREHLCNRAFMIMDTSLPQPLSSEKFKFRNTLESTLVFVFTGQGAQWPAMGKSLFEKFKSFRDDIKHMDNELQSLEPRPSWRLEGEQSSFCSGLENIHLILNFEDEIVKESPASRISEAEISQPATTAIQIGLVNLLANWGILPASVVGHSSGEIVAAYSAGALSARSAIIIAYFRGIVAKAVDKPGSMAAIGLGWNETAALLPDDVRVACENSPQSVTISGNSEGIDDVLARIQKEKPDVPCRRLRVNTAYHSGKYPFNSLSNEAFDH